MNQTEAELRARHYLDREAPRTERESAEIKAIFDVLHPETHKLGIALTLSCPCEYDEWCQEVKDGHRERQETLKRAIVILDVRYDPLGADDPADWNWSTLADEDVRVIGSLSNVPFAADPDVPEITVADI